MSRFAPFEVKSRYFLALCHLSIALARLYYLGTVVSVYFTGTVRERACTTSVLYLSTVASLYFTGTGIRRTGICRSLTAAPEALREGIFLA